jgi:hypothetical protein
MLDVQKRPIIEVKKYLRTLVELGRVAERFGYVRIPASKKWGKQNISARALLDLRGTELETLFSLGIEEVK